MYELGKEEKQAIILSHMRNVSMTKYNAQLCLIEEQALPSPNSADIQATNDTIALADAQLAALQQEYDLVTQAE